MPEHVDPPLLLSGGEGESGDARQQVVPQGAEDAGAQVADGGNVVAPAVIVQQAEQRVDRAAPRAVREDGLSDDGPHRRRALGPDPGAHQRDPVIPQRRHHRRHGAGHDKAQHLPTTPQPPDFQPPDDGDAVPEGSCRLGLVHHSPGASTSCSCCRSCRRAGALPSRAPSRSANPRSNPSRNSCSLRAPSRLPRWKSATPR